MTDCIGLFWYPTPERVPQSLMSSEFFSSLKNNVYKSGGYKIKVKLFPALQRALNTELERCQPLGYVSDCLGMCRLLNISQILRVLFSKNFPYE